VRFANGAQVTLQRLGPGVKGYVIDELLSPLRAPERGEASCDIGYLMHTHRNLVAAEFRWHALLLGSKSRAGWQALTSFPRAEMSLLTLPEDHLQASGSKAASL
jgi:hypothetical protein